MSMKIPFLRPAPPRLSGALDKLREIEASGVYSNFGPQNTRFERRLVDGLFGGIGGCATVCNATIGLMLAIKAAVERRDAKSARYALMPCYTFAATAHAALWSGLIPVFCDIDRDTWLPCRKSEVRLLEEYGSQIAVVVPYATFGAALDLARYATYAERYGVTVVVDAAASLGTLDRQGKGFGAGFPFPIVFSMHVTKTFSTTEAGVIYAADVELVEQLRAMSNFGFGESRHATMPGLNGKLSEVAAVSALLRLDGFDRVVERRQQLYNRYRTSLHQFVFQKETALRQAHQFVPALVPEQTDPSSVSAALTGAEIGHAGYFRPHLADQFYFRKTCITPPTPVTDEISRRSLSLPLHDGMTFKEVDAVCEILNAVVEKSFHSDRNGG